jgi:hypothetical protein
MEMLQLLVDRPASAEAKIALFRSLFRGREDVYPRRFESRTTGKSGYAPACSGRLHRLHDGKRDVRVYDYTSRRGPSISAVSMYGASVLTARIVACPSGRRRPTLRGRHGRVVDDRVVSRSVSDEPASLGSLQGSW